MKKILLQSMALCGTLACLAASCATTGNGGGSAGAGTGNAETVVRAAPVEDNAVYEGDGLSLAEAIEQSAEKITADLPVGSRVAFAAWESPNLGLSDYIMEELTGALVDRGMEVADRQNLEYVYRELNFQVSGVVSDESARFIGNFLGADLVITGQLTELGGPYRYRVNAINVESATRDSVTRFDVRGDAAMRRMVTALATWKPAVKTASYGEDGTSVSGTAGTFLDRGITLASQGEFEMAIEDFTEALRLDGNNTAIYLNRGEAYAQKEDYDKAIADFNQAIRLDPNNDVAYHNRGIAYYNKKDYDRAIADYTQAIRLNPDYAGTYNQRGSAYRGKGDYDRAIADYTQAMQIEPNDAVAYHNRGNAYLNKGDYDRAIVDYTQAIRFDPDYAVTYNQRGNAYSNKRDYDRAITDYTQAIRLDPNYVAAYNNRGVTYNNKRDYDRAIMDYKAALLIDPNYTDAKNNLEIAWRARWRDDPDPPPPGGNFIPYFDDTGDPWPDAPDL